MNVKKIITVTKSIDCDIFGATLLTTEEAKQLPQEILTTVADNWWLRSPGISNENAACVFGKHGYVHPYGDCADKEFGVRPAITFVSSDLEVGDKFITFGYEWTVVFPNKALCDDVIGYSAFRKDWQMPDANDYEKSDIKKYIDSWFTYEYYDREDDAE